MNPDGSLYRYDPSNPLPSAANPQPNANVPNSQSSHHLSLKDTHRGDSTGERVASTDPRVIKSYLICMTVGTTLPSKNHLDNIKEPCELLLNSYYTDKTRIQR